MPRLYESSKLPIPYGSIPKHNKKTSIIHKKKAVPSSTPYPFFSSPTSNSFFAFINHLFGNHDKETGPVGFMPCATLHTTRTQMSQLDIIVPVTSPIDCYYNDGGDSSSYDNCSSLSSSSSSSSSSQSDGSINSFNSSFAAYMDEEARVQVRNGWTNNSSSTAALSDILCDHYVQTQMNTPPSVLSSSDEMIDVPLETFRMFEAPPTNKEQNWRLGQSSASFLNEEKEWTLVETLSKQKRVKPKERRRKSSSNSSSSNNINSNSMKLSSVSSSSSEKEQNDDDDDDISEEQAKVEEQKDNVILARYCHDRDTRANAAYLRMIVAEVNMMRSQKIVGPLRPRRVLPKRSDRFMHRPSPLQLIMV